MAGFGIITSLSLVALAARAHPKTVWATPHDSFSSSIGVLGCKIDTGRVAYWPESVDCNNICVKLSYEGRSVHLLRIDQSGGAYDISYDAWNYLQTGKSAATDPIVGGPVGMEAEEVDASECASLINTPGSKLPLSAANSINFLSSCLAQPNSWVAKNHVLYNICDSICTLGQDEECTLDLAVSNQPSCPHTLGLTSKLTSAPVFNILYQSGKTVVAGSGEVVPPQVKKPAPVEDTPAPPKAPAPPSSTTTLVPSTPTAAVFKDDNESTKAPAVPTQISVLVAQPTAPISVTSDWTTLVASHTELVPTVVSVAPVPSHNVTLPGFNQPTVSAPTTFAVVAPSSSSQAAAPSNTRTVTVNAGGSGLRGSLMAALAGAMAAIYMVA